MSPEKQRIAIAEFCGWTGCKIIGGDRWFGIPSNQINLGDNYRLLPDYLNDLNAMHDAVTSALDKEKGHYNKYLNNLSRIIGISGRLAQNHIEAFKYNNATATQRAEAFLKAIGRWEEEQ